MRVSLVPSVIILQSESRKLVGPDPLKPIFLKSILTALSTCRAIFSGSGYYLNSILCVLRPRTFSSSVRHSVVKVEILVFMISNSESTLCMSLVHNFLRDASAALTFLLSFSSRLKSTDVRTSCKFFSSSSSRSFKPVPLVC